VSTPEERIDELLHDMRKLVRRTSETYLSLARAGGAAPSREWRIDKSYEKREKLSRELGLEVLKLVAQGASIQVVYPIDPDDPRGHRKAALELLREARRSIGPVFPPVSGARAEHKVLSEVARRVGQPRKLSTMDDYRLAVENIEAAVRHIDGWLLLPRSQQQIVIGLVSSLGQIVQQGPPLFANRLRPTFSTLVAWSRENRPGYVTGLSRHNDPEDGTWLATAQKWYVRLEEELSSMPGTSRSELEDLQHALRQGVGPRDHDEFVQRVEAMVNNPDLEREVSVRLLSTLMPHRSLLQGQEGLELFCELMEEAVREEDAERAVADADFAVPEDSEVLERTRDAVLVVVGGDAPPGAPDRIEAAFELAEVRWLGAGIGELDPLVSDVKAGEVPLVILHRGLASYRSIDALVPLAGSHDVVVRVVDDLSLKSVHDVLGA